jgi:hypothetical protein
LVLNVIIVLTPLIKRFKEKAKFFKTLNTMCFS